MNRFICTCIFDNLIILFRVKTEQECNTVQTCHQAAQYDSYGKAIDNCHDEVKCKQVK